MHGDRARPPGLPPSFSTFQKLFGGWMRSRETVGDAAKRRSNEPCSGATGRVQKPFCARSTKSQASDSPPNSFPTLQRRMPTLDIIVLTAPSGAGKTTIAHRVMEAMPDVEFSVSATTRAPRSDETDGEDSHFVSEERFPELADAGDLLEYEEVYSGDYYGTLRSEVETKAAEHPVLLDIDVRGALNVKRRYGDDALLLFIAPPSMEELRRRLETRGTESDDSFRTRIERAEMEMQQRGACDAVVVNDDLDRAVEETLVLIRQFLNR